MHEYKNVQHVLNLYDDAQEIVRIQQEFRDYMDQELKHVQIFFVLFQIYLIELIEQLNEVLFQLLVEDLKMNFFLVLIFIKSYHKKYFFLSNDL